MGLDNFKTEKPHEIGKVKSRKKMENIKLKERRWKHIFFHDPVYAKSICYSKGESEIKAIIQTLDEILQEGIEGVNMSEDEEKDIRRIREEIVSEHLRD